MSKDVLEKCFQTQKSTVIISATIGGIIEWYELFLYVYWTPIISELFFGNDSKYSSSLKILFIFFVGFLARPIGGIIFGHLGDKYGRKSSFVKSIVFMSLPSLFIGFLPFQSLMPFSPFILCILRFLQGLPAGGELPGAMCYLAESATKSQRSYICSYSFLGPQIGIILSMIECYLFEKYLSYESLVTWGWRLSFIIGGILGFIGFYLRRRLHETPIFLKLQEHKKILRKPFIQSLLWHKKEICIGFFASFLDVVGFYLFSIFVGVYFDNVLKINHSQNLLISILSMSISTISLPLLGKLGDKFLPRKLLIYSGLSMMGCIVLFHIAASNSIFYLTIFLEIILVILLNIQFAMLPVFLAELFPTSTRYTGIGMSFNLCDSVIGGFIPLIALYATNSISHIAVFSSFLMIAAIISTITFTLAKDKQII